MPAHSATGLSRSPGLDACDCCGFEILACHLKISKKALSQSRDSESRDLRNPLPLAGGSTLGEAQRSRAKESATCALERHKRGFLFSGLAEPAIINCCGWWM